MKYNLKIIEYTNQLSNQEILENIIRNGDLYFIPKYDKLWDTSIWKQKKYQISLLDKHIKKEIKNCNIKNFDWFKISC